MLVLAYMLSQDSKYVAEDFFLTWLSKKFHTKLLDSVPKQEEDTFVGLLPGGRGKFHNVLQFTSCFLPPDFIPLERHRAVLYMLDAYIYLSKSL